MSNTRKATGAKDVPEDTEDTTPEAPAAEPPMDELDIELAQLREQLAAQQAKAADPRAQEIARLKAQLAGEDIEDERDRTIRLLKEELAAKTATPEGEAAELRKALLALQEQINRMQSGVGLIPVPDPQGPAPYLYGAVLADGEVIYAQYPTATHHESTDHGMVPVRSYWVLDPSQHAKARTWADEQTSKAEERASANA